jgi:hypothetical protein
VFKRKSPSFLFQRKEWAGMSKKALLAISGFMGGIGFTMIAFHFNHKNILNESLYFWSAILAVSLVYCLRAIVKKSL